MSLISAVLERKVWLQTSSPIYPNLYTTLVADPGIGKSRIIWAARDYAAKLEKFPIAPTSMSFASLVDRLHAAKREVTRTDPKLLDGDKYNYMYICVDEFGTLISKYDNETIDGLSYFYDGRTYEQTRRTGDLHIKIERPLLSIIFGVTPQNLMSTLPERAWGQGFMSRMLMIFSNERIIGNDFAEMKPTFSEDLFHDLEIISRLYGQFEATTEFKDTMHQWISSGELPVPGHPKLLHYATRRKVHLYKLAMISSVDRSNSLILTAADFNRAMDWLIAAECHMADIFKAGIANADAMAMDEIIHYLKISDRGKGISEQEINRFAQARIPLTSILRIVDVLERSGQIVMIRKDLRSGLRHFKILYPAE